MFLIRVYCHSESVFIVFRLGLHYFLVITLFLLCCSGSVGFLFILLIDTTLVLFCIVSCVILLCLVYSVALSCPTAFYGDVFYSCIVYWFLSYSGIPCCIFMRNTTCCCLLYSVLWPLFSGICDVQFNSVVCFCDSDSMLNVGWWVWVTCLCALSRLLGPTHRNSSAGQTNQRAMM